MTTPSVPPAAAARFNGTILPAERGRNAVEIAGRARTARKIGGGVAIHIRPRVRGSHDSLVARDALLQRELRNQLPVGKGLGPITITSTCRRSKSATAVVTSSALAPGERASRPKALVESQDIRARGKRKEPNLRHLRCRLRFGSDRARARLTARTTTSPITRIGTPWRMAGGSLADDGRSQESAALVEHACHRPDLTSSAARASRTR